jgi:hypothetical protein
MMATLRRGFFTSIRGAPQPGIEFDATYNLCLKWCKRLLECAIATNQLPFLYASAALDAGLHWYMNEPAHVHAALEKIIVLVSPTSRFVEEAQSVFFLLERFKSFPRVLVLETLVPCLQNMAWYYLNPRITEHAEIRATLLVLYEELVRREPLFAGIFVDNHDNPH